MKADYDEAVTISGSKFWRSVETKNGIYCGLCYRNPTAMRGCFDTRIRVVLMLNLIGKCERCGGQIYWRRYQGERKKEPGRRIILDK
jgi:hypothetical protein